VQFAGVGRRPIPAANTDPLPTRESPAEPEAVAAFSRSLNLNGTGQYVLAPDDDALTSASALTIKAWVRHQDKPEPCRG
jgi:hypothetical protein